MFTFNSSAHVGDIDFLDHLQWPDNYDFAETRAINLPIVKRTVHHDSAENIETEKKGGPVSVTSASDEIEIDSELDPVGLKKAFRFAVWSSVIMVRFLRKDFAWRVSDRRLHYFFLQTLIFMIIIPLPLFGASTVYSVAGFSVWVVVGILWTFCSTFAVVLYPLWESRAALAMIIRGMVKASTRFSWCVEVLAYYYLQDVYVPGSGAYVARTRTNTATA